MLGELKNTKRRTVGLKQTTQAIRSGMAEQVFLAKDVDEYIRKKVEAECNKHGLTINYIDTMQEIGVACGINVGAATAAILK